MIRGVRRPGTTTRKYTLHPKYPWCCVFVLSSTYYAWEEFVSLILRTRCDFKASNETNKGSSPVTKEENTKVTYSSHLYIHFYGSQLNLFSTLSCHKYAKYKSDSKEVNCGSDLLETFNAVVALDVIDIFMLLECVKLVVFLESHMVRSSCTGCKAPPPPPASYYIVES